MIANKHNNIVYFSDLLRQDHRFEQTINSLLQILEKHSINYGFLKLTKDIWCRDYMPIQVNENKFVQFRYEPSYLQDDLEHQSNPEIVCRANNINPIFSDINIDGGNVVNWENKVIISDRIFDENPEYSDRTKLIDKIEELLEVKVIIIPQINTDYTGHADGMVRFVDENTILGNDREQELKYWKKGINKVMKENNLEYIDIPFFEWKDKEYSENAIGCYVNYLEIGNLIVLPIFEVKGNRDEEVFRIFKSIFPDRIIETMNYNKIGYYGGLLNCTTWTIKE